VSRYQKGKTNLDFTEARDSEWRWHQLRCMQVCTSLQTDNHTSTPPLSFLQAGGGHNCEQRSGERREAGPTVRRLGFAVGLRRRVTGRPRDVAAVSMATDKLASITRETQRLHALHIHAAPSNNRHTWNWVIGSPGQWVIFHVRVTGSSF